jgi:oxygen-independent coproporphyrinogen III oxidase
MRELGVYVHFPFCRRRCGYCDFSSSEGREIPHSVYADAVLGELRARAHEHAGSTLSTIFIGGGTPSLWEPRELGRVLEEIRTSLAGAAREITLEVNPATLSGDRFAEVAGAGVTRLSIGVQSLDDEALALLGRLHDAASAERAVRDARRAGFASLGCDLLFGLPGQDLAHHADQIRRLVDLGPDHVSTYALSLSAASPLARAGHAPADDDLAADMMELGRELLEGAGLLQYEVSNFARPGHVALHNALVWAGRPYLGLGASAHSMVPEGPSTLRRANHELDRYLAAASRGLFFAPEMGVLERVPPDQARAEVLILGLRTSRGVDRAEYAARFGVDPVLEIERGGRLPALVAAGLVRVEEDRVAPTRRGLQFADEIALRLMP